MSDQFWLTKAQLKRIEYRQRHKVENMFAKLEHDPEKVDTGFPERSCSNKR